MSFQEIFKNSLRCNMQHALTASVEKVCHPLKVKPNQPMPLQRTTRWTSGIRSWNDTELSKSAGRCFADRAISPRSRIRNLFDETVHCPTCSWTTFAKTCAVLIGAFKYLPASNSSSTIAQCIQIVIVDSAELASCLVRVPQNIGPVVLS